MRDHLMEFASQIGDIDQIRQLGRTEEQDGLVRIINEWRVRQQVPVMLRPMLKTDEFRWIDHNTWDPSSCTCSWSIEPAFLSEFIACSGETSFAPAMGGQGTRVSFTGMLDLKPGWLNLPGGAEPVVSGFVESIVTTVIPRNLRAVAEAAAAFALPTDG